MVNKVRKTYENLEELLKKRTAELRTANKRLQKEIIERKQAEGAQQKTEKRFRKVIENIFKFVPEGLLVFTDKMNLFKQNKAFQDIVQKYAAKLNYTESELTEIIIEQVKNRVINEDYAEIRISKNKDKKEKNRQNNF